jgi:hypothetical protein
VISRAVALRRSPDSPHVALDRLLLSRIKEGEDAKPIHVLELYGSRGDSASLHTLVEVLHVTIDDEKAITNLRDQLIAYCQECKLS